MRIKRTPRRRVDSIHMSPRQSPNSRQTPRRAPSPGRAATPHAPAETTPSRTLSGAEDATAGSQGNFVNSTGASQSLIAATTSDSDNKEQDQKTESAAAHDSAVPKNDVDAEETHEKKQVADSEELPDHR